MANKTLEAYQDKVNTLNAIGKEKDRLLLEAANTITNLRHQNQQQGLRLAMFDDLKTLLHTRPSYGEGVGMAPDIVFEINNHLKK